MSTMDVFDTASWGGYCHGNLLGRLYQKNSPRAAPPDFSRATNVMMSSTYGLATEVEASIPAIIERAKSTAGGRTRIREIDEGKNRLLGQLRQVKSLPPVGNEWIWQDMPLGRDLWLVEQPGYIHLPPNLRQIMQTLGYERPAVSAVGFSGYTLGQLPIPVPLEWSANDDELIRRLQAQAEEASGGLKALHPAIIALAIVAGAALLYKVSRDTAAVMISRDERLALEIAASDEVSRRKANDRVVTSMEAGLKACLKQKAALGTDISSCSVFVPPTELQSNLDAFRAKTAAAAGACGWTAGCIKYAGLGAALGAILGVAAAAKYARSIPKITI